MPETDLDRLRLLSTLDWADRRRTKRKRVTVVEGATCTHRVKLHVPTMQLVARCGAVFHPSRAVSVRRWEHGIDKPRCSHCANRIAPWERPRNSTRRWDFRLQPPAPSP